MLLQGTGLQKWTFSHQKGDSSWKAQFEDEQLMA
jgi:hypothetical protein